MAGWQFYLTAVLATTAVAGGLYFAWRRGLLAPRRAYVNLAHARKLFHLRREWLEARFVQLAAKNGTPRGLQLADCEFDNAVLFARDRKTGRLRALVAVTISYQAVVGGGLEDNPNVGNLRAATAVFLLDGKEWSTDGRELRNLSPVQAMERFAQELELAE